MKSPNFAFLSAHDELLVRTGAQAERLRRHSYPWGDSSTLYYGKSNTSIASRLKVHHSGRGSALLRDYLSEGKPLKVRWRRTAGARKTPREIECWHMDRFEANFGSRPLGNLRGCSLGDT